MGLACLKEILKGKKKNYSTSKCTKNSLRLLEVKQATTKERKEAPLIFFFKFMFWAFWPSMPLASVLQLVSQTSA